MLLIIMKIKLPAKEITCTEDAVEIMYSVQRSASKIIKDYLQEPIDKLAADKICSDRVIACGLIQLGYYILRTNRSEKEAVQSFDVTAHFSIQRVEHILAKNKNEKFH